MRVGFRSGSAPLGKAQNFDHTHLIADRKSQHISDRDIVAAAFNPVAIYPNMPLAQQPLR